MGSALESLERIKARQAETSARIESAEELEAASGDGDLNRRLAAAGLMEGESNAAAVLARFKKPAQLGHDTAGGSAPLIGQVRDVQQVPRSDS